MSYYFGVAVKEEHTGACVILAIAVPQNSKSPIPTGSVTYKKARKQYNGVTVIIGDNVTTAINAASHRLIEQLLIKKELDPNTNINAKLLMRLKYRKLHTVIDIMDKSKHWCINAANNALHSWLRGE